MNALPPVPAVWGDGWRDEWLRRIEATEPWLFEWLEQQRDGDYWRHGSVRPDYSRIRCPVMVVAGWADGYRNNSFRTVEALRRLGVPHRLLAGPWAHASPGSALPGPRIDLVPEMVAWWDRWLRGNDSLVDDGLQTPAVTCFVRASTRPEPDLEESRGEWIREEWPSPRTAEQLLTLDARPAHVVRPDIGVDAWIDCAGHLPYGLSTDQRFDDAASLTWEWDAAELTLLGQPVADLRVSVDTPVASVSVRLCDVFPDGTSALVSRGSLNLTHRDSHREPTPLVPGELYDVRVELDACAYRFEPGQRLRLAISGADWPNTAAPPLPVTLTVHAGRLELPRWSGPSPYAPPRLSPGHASSQEDPTGVTWRIERDVLDRVTRCVVDHGATYAVPFDATATEHYTGQVSVDTVTFAQQAHAEASFVIGWHEATVSTHAVLGLVANPASYELTLDLIAREGDRLLAERSWRRSFPRDLA